MSAWGSGSFDNDTALDFIVHLEETGREFEMVRYALEAVLEDDDKRDEDLCWEAIAAAEIVSALNGYPLDVFPDDLLDMLPEWQSALRKADVKHAIKAVKHILHDSGLRDLVFEGGADSAFAVEWVRR